MRRRGMQLSHAGCEVGAGCSEAHLGARRCAPVALQPLSSTKHGTGGVVSTQMCKEPYLQGC